MLDDEDNPLAETEDFYGKYSVQKDVVGHYNSRNFATFIVSTLCPPLL